MKLHTLFLLIVLWGNARAQDCSYFPGDCPETGNIEAARDSEVCINNLVVPQEIGMQNRVRDFVTGLMDEVAKNRQWDLYEYSEEAGGGIGSNGKATPFALRRPHSYLISFDFIINRDSLRGWQEWYSKDLQKASNELVDSYKQSGSNLAQDDNRQKFIDSATFYSQKKAQYMTDHAAEYQKAILSGDAKGQKKFEDAEKRFDDKVNSYLNKTNDRNASAFSSSESQFKDLESYKHKNMIAFRNGSTLRVTVEVNAASATADDGEKKVVKTISQPGASLGMILHNNAPDEHEVFGQFYRSTDLGLVLFGKWLQRKDEYKIYHPLFETDKRNTDAVSAKKIPCDQVQTIVLHVEGSPSNIDQFLRLFDSSRLSSLLAKEN